MNDHKIRTGTGAGTETRAVAEAGTGTGTRTGSGRAEDRRRSALDAMWETGETWAGRENCRHERFGSVAADPDNLENSKKSARGKLKALRA